MQTLKIIAFVVLAIISLTIFVISAKNKRVLKLLFLNALLGAGALVLINALCRFTGVRIEVNEYSVIGSVLYGLPAVCGMAIFKLLF